MYFYYVKPFFSPSKTRTRLTEARRLSPSVDSEIPEHVNGLNDIDADSERYTVGYQRWIHRAELDHRSEP